MWAKILQWAVKIAMFAAQHPDEVKTAVDDAIAVKAVVDAAKK